MRVRAKGDTAAPVFTAIRFTGDNLAEFQAIWPDAKIEENSIVLPHVGNEIRSTRLVPGQWVCGNLPYVDSDFWQKFEPVLA